MNRRKAGRGDKPSYIEKVVAGGQRVQVCANRTAKRHEKAWTDSRVGRSTRQTIREKRKKRLAAARHRASKVAAESRRTNRL